VWRISTLSEISRAGPAFTHISYDDSGFCGLNLIENGDATTEGRMVPYTVYIDPQLGRIGLTETEARAQKKKIRVAKMPMTKRGSRAGSG